MLAMDYPDGSLISRADAKAATGRESSVNLTLFFEAAIASYN